MVDVYKTLQPDRVVTYLRAEPEWSPQLTEYIGEDPALPHMEPIGSSNWRKDYRLQASTLIRRPQGVDELLMTYRYSSTGTIGSDNDRTLENFGGLGNTEAAATDRAPGPGDFVRITVTTDAQFDAQPGSNTFTWYGYILSDTDSWVRERHPDAEVDPDELEAGTLTLRAFGLEHFLDRTQISSAMVAINDDDLGGVKRVGRAMTFNGGLDGLGTDGSDATRGNRSYYPKDNAVNDAGATGEQYAFASDDADETPSLWYSDQMLVSLLAYQPPRDEVVLEDIFPDGRVQPCKFDLAGKEVIQGGSPAAATTPLKYFAPTVPTENRTILEVLNQIARPSRGLCWTTQYDEPTATLTITVHTLALTDTPLPGGNTLPENDTQWQLDADGDPSVLQQQLGQAGETRYNSIRFRGARQTTTFTLSKADGNLDKDWLDADETDYKAAASAAIGYAGLSEDDQKRRNDAMRSEPKFDRVYAAFRVPRDWDGKSGDGSGTVLDADKGTVFGQLDEYGALVLEGGEPVTTPVYLAGMRILEETRLLAASPRIGLRKYEPPTVYFEDEEGKWRLAERMNDAAAPTGTERLASYHLQVEEGGLSILLTSTSGLAHTLAETDFTGAEPSRRTGEVDWRDMRATVTVETDSYCEAIYREGGTVTGTPLEELVVDLGEDYRLDYLAENTITSVSDGVLSTSGPLVLRDDRKTLEDLAAAAMRWYRIPRRSLAITLRNIHTAIEPGSMITHLGQTGYLREVGSVVGEVSWNFIEGHTTIKTLDGEITVGGMLA